MKKCLLTVALLLCLVTVVYAGDLAYQLFNDDAKTYIATVVSYDSDNRMVTLQPVEKIKGDVDMVTPLVGMMDGAWQTLEDGVFIKLMNKQVPAVGERCLIASPYAGTTMLFRYTGDTLETMKLLDYEDLGLWGEVQYMLNDGRLVKFEQERLQRLGQAPTPTPLPSATAAPTTEPIAPPPPSDSDNALIVALALGGVLVLAIGGAVLWRRKRA